MFGSSINVVEDLLIPLGLVTVQAIYAGYGVFIAHFLAQGLDPLFFVIYGSLVTGMLLTPFALYLERNQRPAKFDPALFIQFLLISLGGVTVFQTLLLMGIKKTSPAYASAMPNLAPTFIFVIAWCLKLEKVDLKCMYTRVKILGALVCVSGALAMSFFQGTPVSYRLSGPSTIMHVSLVAREKVDHGRLIGCMYLLTAVFVVSCTMILQAATLAEYPAPLSLCAITSLIGAFITTIVKLLQDRNLDTGLPSMGYGYLISIALMGGFVNGLCTTFHAWSVKKRGPVLVSVFSPVGTVCSAILSMLLLGEALHIGSLGGMFLIFSGLYFVLWAKKKEGYAFDETSFKMENDDITKPLLS
ncbi:hypothetical protein AMTRI_Chr13g83660 [Amborella trichopoda]|uniref:WAT1-related protein n=1 Tax=Amborella trichopoda TaxID=13333 RepID=W1P1C4_AMBTC|nr:WAT1-related protein At5g47470 [Amborella trichopoda]ERN00740.1 hypothetical protein AMTR_s00106p00117520 [Amborella trichopoda]|eukprot:XP_006838171.1 WAT1-related protein At5g47470 [Amborella trichopoda]